MIKLGRIASLVMAVAVVMSSTGFVMTQVFAAETNIKGSDAVIFKYVKNQQGLRNYIDNDGAYSSQDEIVTKWKGYSDVHRLVVPENGKLVFFSNCKVDGGDDQYAEIELFSNYA